MIPKRILHELSFFSATKKPIPFSYDTKQKANSFMIYTGSQTTFTTLVDGKIETTHPIKNGDIVLTGPKKEQWVMSFLDFMEKYNIIDGKAIPKPILRTVAKVPKSVFERLKLPNPYPFEAPWKETMYLEPEDYLVKDKKGYYRIENKIFTKTYTV